MEWKCPDCGNGVNFNHQGCNMPPTSAPDLPDIDKVLQMTKDMELISDFLTNGRFVGDRVYVSIEHLAECIRNTRPQSEASAEALEVFDAMIKYGEHQMECSFEELLNNMKVKEAKQTIRAALATPVGCRPIETAPKDGTRVLLWTAAYIGDKREFIIPAVGYWSESKQEWRGFYNQYFKPTHWQPLPAPPHTEERG